MGRVTKIQSTQEADDRAIEIMIGEKKSISQAREMLHREGYGDVSLSHLQVLKKNAFDSLVKQYKTETTAEFMLESLKKITLEFEDLYNKFKTLYTRFENEGKTFEQIVVLKELKSMLHMSLKKLGEYSTAVEKSKDTNIYVSNSDVILMVKEAQEKLFSDSKPEMVAGTLVLRNPTPEMVDTFHRWRFKNTMRLPNASAND